MDRRALAVGGAMAGLAAAAEAEMEAVAAVWAETASLRAAAER